MMYLTASTYDSEQKPFQGLASSFLIFIGTFSFFLILIGLLSVIQFSVLLDPQYTLLGRQDQNDFLFYK